MDELDELLGIDKVESTFEETRDESALGNKRRGAGSQISSPMVYMNRYEAIYDLINVFRGFLLILAVLIGLALVIGVFTMIGQDGPPAIYALIYGVGGVFVIGFILALRTALLLGVALVDTAVHTAPIRDDEKLKIIRLSSTD